MGRGGLPVLALLSLLVVASDRNKGEEARCWAKGKEVTLRPDQCPAEFADADAKFCCRLCYGANCCLPKRPRVNLAKCPRGAWLAGATQDHRTTQDAKATSFFKSKTDWSFLALLVPLSVLALALVCLFSCPQDCKRGWESCRRFCSSRAAREARADAPPPPARPAPLPAGAPPPYSRADPAGAPGPDPPPPYPGPPAVAFRRARSRLQDDQVFLVAPEAAATGGAPEAAAAASPLEGAAYCGPLELPD